MPSSLQGSVQPDRPVRLDSHHILFLRSEEPPHSPANNFKRTQNGGVVGRSSDSPDKYSQSPSYEPGLAESAETPAEQTASCAQLTVWWEDVH